MSPKDRRRAQRKNRKKALEKPPKSQVTTEVLLADIERRLVIARSIRVFVTMLGLALVVLAMWPVAHELSGEDTTLNVTIALSLTAAVTLAGTGVAIWGESQRRRANRLDVRNKTLSRDVKELQQRLRDNHLPDSVSE